MRFDEILIDRRLSRQPTLLTKIYLQVCKFKFYKPTSSLLKDRVARWYHKHEANMIAYFITHAIDYLILNERLLGEKYGNNFHSSSDSG